MAYREDRTVEKIGIGLTLFASVLFALGWMTREDPANKPYLIIAGGGFVYNYRISEAFYGFTALVAKPLRNGSIIEAKFEDPAGGEPMVVRQRVRARSDRYGLRTPRLHGVKAGQSYHVAIRLYDYTGTDVLFSADREYISQVDESVLPDKPLTVGPGYHAFPGPGAKCASGGCDKAG